MLTSKNKVIIYAQDAFSGSSAKTAIGFIKYGLSETVGIVDKKLASKTVNQIYNGLPPIPIFDSVDSAKKNKPDADVLLIGIAPAGGDLPKEWIPDIKNAIKYKLNIVNGLHDFLSDIDEIRTLAQSCGVYIWDVRKTSNKFPVANGRLLDYPIQIILSVGTDAAIGKMTVTLELVKAAKLKNTSAKFIATGQTGMMISGDGIPIDAIIGDFMAGAIEEELVRAAKQNYKIAFVEGQGSILHPAWSPVTLALLHGALPHKLILCHKAKRENLKNTDVKIESLSQFIKIYENLSLPLRKAHVVGISLNTYGMDEKEANTELKRIEDEVCLPVCDPIRNGVEKLLDACLN